MSFETIALNERIIQCKVHCRKVGKQIDLSALNELFAALPNPAILGGNNAKLDGDGFSYWAAEPREIFEFNSNEQKPFGKLQQVLEKYRLQDVKHDDLPMGMFCGGWIGYFGYELGRYIERISETATDDIKMPLIRLCFYDKVLCYDHKNRSFWLIALELEDQSSEPIEKLDWLSEKLKEAEQIRVQPKAPARMENIDLSKVQCNMDEEYYLKSVERIRRYIYDGIVYQVNFSQRFECDYNARPIELFHWQNQHNPSGYSAYIDTEDFAIVSASPEMFITLTNNVISTKPIKGTRPRTPETNNDSKRINERNFIELVRSEKEQAELNMIIDLERNDLARICRPGTRCMTQPRTIESYPTVFHAVATISGQLRPQITFCDILRAMFPGGSITGAPKVSAMEIIDQIEPTARGIYTGSIGYIGVDGNACLNIAIRGVIVKDGKAYIQTGGGIVADSDPQAEWDETIVKARALLAGINNIQRRAYKK
jgi:para-aminobenzoate synthetase component 1